jgi:hypothetical protein
MASQTKIYNLALSKLGEARINSTDEDSNQARKCNEIYDEVLDECLADGPEDGWRFAVHRVAVSVDADEPAFDYDYRYALPADLIKILQVTVSGVDLEDWLREGQYILTSEEDEEIDLIYVRRITSTGLFPPHFVKVLYMTMAVQLAYNLSQSSTLAERLLLELGPIRRKAMFIDSRGKYVQEFNTDWEDEGH